MLIKRILLVALIATMTTKLMCSVDSGAMRDLHQYGVQSNRISDTDFNNLINQAKLVDDWNSPDLAVSSIVRAQFTDTGDTTLAGINRAPAGVNPADLQALIDPTTDKSGRQMIADKILRGPSAGAGAGSGGASTELAARSDEDFKGWVRNIGSAWGHAETGDLQTDIQNMRNAANSTLLTAAVGENNPLYVDYLLDLGINPSVVNTEGKMAVEYSSNPTITAKINSRS